MELWEYLRILRRRWWIPLMLTILVGIISIIQLGPQAANPWYANPPSHYNVRMRLLLGVMPEGDVESTAYDPRYYAWLTSEYLVDDFTEVIRSELFAKNVSQRLANRKIDVPPDILSGSTATGKQHRIITVSFAWPSESEAQAIALAVSAELQENADHYFRQLGTDGATIAVLDGPSIAPVEPSTREQVEFPLRIFLGLVAGLLLAFFVEYLDDTVRELRDLEELGLPPLGTIPKHK